MKNLNKYISLCAILFCMYGINAQGKGRERIKTLKVAYITEELNLTVEEAQNFWPLYNAHEEKMRTIRKGERGNFKSYSDDSSSISDEQAKTMVSSILSFRAKKLEAEEHYIKKLENVIPPKKIILLIKAEESFKRRLLQQYRNKRKAE